MSKQVSREGDIIPCIIAASDVSMLSGGLVFSQVVMEVMGQLEGAYALIFKSPHFPDELVACKRGSPLLLGVKVGGEGEVEREGAGLRLEGSRDGMGQEGEGTEEKEAFVLSEGGGGGQPREYFLSSDASAVVEHTKKVLVIEDNEVVHIRVPAPPHPLLL